MAEDNRMSEQEENWHIMTTLGLPWSECKQLDEEDRLFLMSRVHDVHRHAQQQTQDGTMQSAPPELTEDELDSSPRKVFKYD